MSFYSLATLCAGGRTAQEGGKRSSPSCARRANPSAPVVIEGRTIAKTLLGQGLVRQSRALQRLREPASARPHLCAQRLGAGPADRQGRGQWRWSAGPSCTRSRLPSPRWQGTAGKPFARIAPVPSIRSSSCCRASSPRASWNGSAGRAIGLFPAPGEIELACSCPDWADMCKHVAAVLYGVGARLDASPEMLFVLRGVDEKDLVAGASGGLPVRKAPTSKRKVLADDDVAALFGLDMAEAASAETTPGPAAAKQSRKLAESAAKPKAADGRRPSRPKPPAGRKTVTSLPGGKRPPSGMVRRTLRS